MPNAVKWSALGSTTTNMSTALDSLANDGRVLGAEIDNATDRNMYADFELYVDSFGSAPATDGHVLLYLLQALDGTNYEDGDASTTPGSHALVGSFPFRTVATAQRITLRHLLLPATKCKPLLINKGGAGATFASSGNTLRVRTYNSEVQ